MNINLNSFKKHLINKDSSIKEALMRLDILAKDAIIFVVTEDNKLIGSLTDGDVRRALLKGIGIDGFVNEILQQNPRYIRKGEHDINKVIEYREKNYRIIPILDKEDHVVNVINFSEVKSYLPIDVVIMAGGKGERLLPLTKKKPKPLLKVGDKPILEHNINRLVSYGIDDFWISVNYLGKQIESYFGDGSDRNIKTQYVWESKPLGTIGALSTINNFQHDYILITNSDILTNLDFEHFFLDFLNQNADFSVVTIPYQVNIPYAVLETNSGHIIDLKEKPTYTYYSNGGIYLMKRSCMGNIPKSTFYNTTDLIEGLIKINKKVVSYPLQGYWLDIGNHIDLQKANKDIHQIKF